MRAPNPKSVPARARDAAVGTAQQVRGGGVLLRSGIVRPYTPDKLAKIARTLRRWGRGPAGGYTALAIRFRDEVGLVDDLGSLTFGEIHNRTNALARSFASAGVREGDSVAVMCRNHRGFIESTVAAAKLGADVLYLNTAFSGPQITGVLEREQPRAIVYDEEFTDVLEEAPADTARFLAWTESEDRSSQSRAGGDAATLDELIERSDSADLDPPSRVARTVILTSGTTGTPKGANRGAGSIAAATSLLSRLELRDRWTCHIAAPLFHTWGWAHFQIGMLLGTTLVLRRRFDPETCLAAIATERCQSLAVVPVMLQRILELAPNLRSKYDTTCLRAVAASGSSLPGDLSDRWMDTFGDNLFNIYGSTEVAWATIASPKDLRRAPGTAGKPPLGTVVKIYGQDGRPVPKGETGRIFVANVMLFEGYTGGESKDSIDGLMATGDLGRFDADGRLFVEGRDDEMIVSGGENVYPAEVEDLLARHEAVIEAAAIGVDDEKFGSRLRAFVVLDSGKNVSEDDLKTYVKSNLAGYKVPREIWFLPELPRNATGKVLKRELKEVEAQ